MIQQTSAPFTLILSLGLALGIATLSSACTTHETTDPAPPDQETIDVCEAYVKAHVTCFGRTGAREQDTARAEGERMRAQYLGAASDPTRRDETRKACAASLVRMKTACP